VEHDFPRLGRRRMLLNAHRLSFDSRPTHMILLAIEEDTSRKTKK